MGGEGWDILEGGEGGGRALHVWEERCGANPIVGEVGVGHTRLWEAKGKCYVCSIWLCA